jgi:Ca-activated chloride channel family protein
VFTDGEETSGNMAASTETAIRYGIPVFFVGFGSEIETEIISGDSVTPVKTALRSDALRTAAASVKGSSVLHPAQAVYVEATADGSAAAILKTIARTAERGVTFEPRPIAKHRVFLFLALLCFMTGILASELHISRFGAHFPALITLAVCLLSFQSCSGKLGDAAQILESVYNWRRGDYQEAVAGFLAVIERAQESGDRTLLQYGLYGLASTYIAQGEYAAAQMRFDEIDPDAPADISFSVLYNSGVIAYNNGSYDSAAQSFRRALELKPASVDAKVNLELASSHADMQSLPAEQEVIPTSAHDDQTAAQNALFSIIREDEQNRWKNSQTQTEKTTEPDY